jgi:excisionase family DNA binding protein
MNEEQLIRIPKAAKILNVSYSFLDRMIHEGKVKIVPMGKGRRITKFEIGRILAEGIF